jgi:TRAP-type C4-dicarboxylate transport system permease large subunit
MSDEAVTGPDLAARQHGEETRTANAIYGVIVSTAVMASVKRGDSVGRLAVAVLVTLLVYWAAERYAHVMARRIGLGRRQTHAEVRQELSSGWELVTASFLPVLVLLGTHWLGADLSGSVLSALACGTVLLCLVGWRVGREAQLGLVKRLLSAAFAGAIGVVMIALKTTLH